MLVVARQMMERMEVGFGVGDIPIDGNRDIAKHVRGPI